ncbi:MAG: hypothetical protein KJ069_07010 [Anaerolineae bacterium]|nr:hypothetical protein [Anaerolineae bacterium]
MSEQDKFEQVNESQDSYPSRRERRAQRRADRQAGGFGWFAGLILIVIGGLYLLHDAGYLPALTNWWALFLLLPGAGVLSAALGAYRQNGGHWTSDVLGLLLFSLLFFGMTAVFLFGLNFGWLLPLFLIAAGLLLLFSPKLAQR